MQLKHTIGAKLTLDSGETVQLERIGKGSFHTCYLDAAASRVYSITIDRPAAGTEDYSKEILSNCDANIHIPPVEHVGNLGDRRVYRMPYYQPMQAKYKAAWEQLKTLTGLREKAWTEIVREQVMTKKLYRRDIGYLVNQRLIEMVDGIAATHYYQTLRDGLEELAREAQNYGSSYVFEFAKRNCLVHVAVPHGQCPVCRHYGDDCTAHAADGGAALVLVDCLFNLEAAERMETERRNKAGVGVRY